jgi:PAS domain S-box-containing protein
MFRERQFETQLLGWSICSDMQDPLRILVVDDDDLNRRAASRILRQYRQDTIVEEAATRAEATDAVGSRSFDCVLLDCHLPDGDGLSWLVDTREAGDNTPIIVLTGHGDENLAVEAMRAGATDYLPKGELTPQLLGHCLRSALRYHQSQEQVRRAREELQLRDRAIAAASNGIVIADPHQPDCPIIYVNPAFTAITGYPPEEILGRNCRFLQGPETDPQYVNQVRDCLRGERECQVVLRNHRRDGTPFWVELTVSPMRGLDGAVTHFIGIQTDITERRDAEEALRVNVARQQALLRDMFSSVTDGRLTLCASEGELPEPHPRFADPVRLTRTGGIRELRRHAIGACVAVGITDLRRLDLETAVGETAMNAVVHAGGGTGHVFAHERGTVQVRVEDEG